MARQTNLRIQILLEQLGRRITTAELARVLDVSDATVAGYLSNRWPVVDRLVLERMADYFDCEVRDLFETTESRFFDRFRGLDTAIGNGAVTHGPSPCIFMLRPDADRMTGGRSVAFRDNRAMDSLANLLRDNVQDLPIIEHSAQTLSDFDEYSSHNCVAVGAPTVNPATDFALRQAFNFSESGSGFSPFEFRFAAECIKSPFAAITGEGQKPGIWMKKEKKLLEADHWPPDEFRSRPISKGRDCGVVVVLNRDSPGRSPRKLIVLAGFGGAGTEATAIALVANYRDLEPINGESLVWGIIEVTYTKDPNSINRVITNPSWRCRTGGRLPIHFR